MTHGTPEELNAGLPEKDGAERSQEDEKYIKFAQGFQPLLRSLRGLSPSDWSTIDQAIDAAKIAYGPKANPSVVGALIDDALLNTPKDFSGERLALFMSIYVLDLTEEALAADMPPIKEQLVHLWSRHGVWLGVLVRTATASQLDWMSIWGNRLTQSTDRVRLRLQIYRRDGDKFLLELSAASAIKLAGSILMKTAEELESELPKLSDKDFALLDKALDRLRPRADPDQT